MRDIWNNPFLPIYRKKGEEVAAQASWVASECFENILEGPKFENLKIAICTPF